MSSAILAGIHLFTIMITFIIFTVSAVSDIKTFTVAPLNPIVFVYIVAIIDAIIIGTSLSDIIVKFIFALIVFVIFVLIARFLGGGGGDAVLMPILPLVFGVIPALCIIFASCILTTIFVVAKRLIKKEKIRLTEDIPLIPGVAFCIAIYVVFALFFGW